MWRALLCLLLIALPAKAEEVVLGLSQDEVAITANFDGSQILVFGAVKREAPIPAGPPLEVVVAVSGPSEPVIVRRKAKRFGIWVNAKAVEVDSAPAFYAVASSNRLENALSEAADKEHRVSIDRAIVSVAAQMTNPEAVKFVDAIMRIRQGQGLYKTLENSVSVDEQTLFRTAIDMPANLIEGIYPTRIFLTRGGEVVSSYETSIDVRKVGLERWIYKLSRENPLIYGLMSLAIAIFSGWGASAIFTLWRQR